MREKQHISIAALGLVALVLIAYLFLPKLAPLQPPVETSTTPAIAAHPATRTQHPVSPAASDSSAADISDSDTDTPKEALLTFADEASYQAFLSTLDSRGLQLLGSSERLLTLRVGFSTPDQLADINGAELSINYPVTIPLPPTNGGVQEGAQPFGSSALQSLGIFGDNSQWGAGVTVAVIDTGINAHLALPEGITQIELAKLANGTTQLSHGTAVASIIAGTHPLTKGVAPAAQLLSIRITDATGSSNAFTLAEGILSAVDAGAQVINISMGSTGDSPVVARAVAYAQSRGAVIVASAGNEGYSALSYPAAYPGVVSVGSIDALGQHLDFSNSSDAGTPLSLVAPGYEVYAAWGDSQLTSFTGTSASAPFVSGAIAAVLSENPQLSPRQAADRVLQLSNEAGPIGADSQYGQGSLDVGRVMEYGQSGVYDLAVTSQMVELKDNGSAQLTVLVQNQGTETLFNSPLTVQTPFGNRTININSLTPGQVYTSTLPLGNLRAQNPFTVTSTVNTSSQTDSDPRNNTRQSSFTPNAQ